MELLKFVRRRSFVSEVVYTVLNIVLAIAVTVTIYYTNSIWLALVVVLLSKWRIFAVRPRYWVANVLSNIVDIIVSISTVMLLYTTTTIPMPFSQELALLAVGTLLYIFWLLVIKPRSKRAFVVAQAVVAIFLGTTALFTVAYNWPVSIVVLLIWIVGYSAARHVLNTYDEETHGLVLAIIWGLILAEITWVSYHWAIAYAVPLTTNVLIPQASIIVTLVSFVVYKAYDSFMHHQKVRSSDIILPLLFTLSIIVVLLVFFNRVGTSI